MSGGRSRATGIPIFQIGPAGQASFTGSKQYIRCIACPINLLNVPRKRVARSRLFLLPSLPRAHKLFHRFYPRRRQNLLTRRQTLSVRPAERGIFRRSGGVGGGEGEFHSASGISEKEETTLETFRNGNGAPGKGGGDVISNVRERPNGPDTGVCDVYRTPSRTM